MEAYPSLRIDLEATVLLSAAFLDATRGWRGDRRILNISSGLGRRAMASSAVYCAAKAGMDHLTRSLALEEARENLPGWDPRLPSSRAIGGPELIAHLTGEMSLVEATEAATLASRQYAKRQRTWFRSNMKAWRQVSLP